MPTLASIVKRMQLFEFCDQPWFRGVFRDGYMDCLNNLHRAFRPYAAIPPLLARWARRGGAHEILDVAAGGGDQIMSLLETHAGRGNLPRFVLSDLHPQVEKYRRLADAHGPGAVGFIEESTSVERLPDGFSHLCVFSAFHHFPPAVARAFLRNVQERRDGLLIVEFTTRNIVTLLSMIPAFFFNWLTPLFTPRFRWAKLLWGMLLPIIPLAVVFDGIVSALRSYTSDEIAALLPEDWDKDFELESGALPWGRSPWMKAHYFQLTRKQRIPVNVTKTQTLAAAGPT
jgi:hypothetical protein